MPARYSTAAQAIAERAARRAHDAWRAAGCPLAGPIAARMSRAGNVERRSWTEEGKPVRPSLLNLQPR